MKNVTKTLLLTMLVALGACAVDADTSAPVTASAEQALGDPVVNLHGQVAIDYYNFATGAPLCVAGDPDDCTIDPETAQLVVDNGDPSEIYYTIPHVFGRTPRGFEHGVPDSIEADGVTVNVLWESGWVYAKNIWSIVPDSPGE